MERRYLVAALAIIATFVGVSHGLRSLQCFALKHPVHVSLLRGDSDFGSRAAAKIGTHLRPGFPEEAQLLAEMNVPIASLEAKMAQQMATRNMAAAQCAAQATAMRQAERARQDAMRVRDRMLRAYPIAMPAPISLQVNVPDEVNRRLAINMATLASRLAEQQMRLQIAANKLPPVSVRIALPDMSVVDTYDNDRVSTSTAIHGRCNHKNSEVERSAGEAAREAMGQTE
jgi:hypothetical protein